MVLKMVDYIGMDLIVVLMFYSFMMFLLNFDTMKCLYVN